VQAANLNKPLIEDRFDRHRQLKDEQERYAE
jgi:hypothetical protein